MLRSATDSSIAFESNGIFYIGTSGQAIAIQEKQAAATAQIVNFALNRAYLTENDFAPSTGSCNLWRKVSDFAP